MVPDATPPRSDRPAVGIERPRTDPVQYEIERQILCDRIDELKRELECERRQRQQIVEQYERLLDEQREKTAGVDGLLEGLF